MKTRRNILLAVAAIGLAVALAAPASAQQMFKSNPGGKGVSATIIAPRSGVAKLPAGWTADSAASHANCRLAGESLIPTKGAAVWSATFRRQ